MNAKVHPLQAALVIVSMLVAVGLWAYADGRAKSLGGPAVLLTDDRGHLYLQVHNQLLEHGANGAFLRRHDLGELGVPVLIGDLAFLSNGDLLLRRGADPRSFIDRLRAFRRETNTNLPTPQAADAGLHRCRLATAECVPFAEPPIDPGATFGLFVDAANDRIYLSDTSRHLLRAFTADGFPAATPAGDFRFPNELAMHDGRLLVADTNNHRVAVVAAGADDFGELLRAIDVVPPEAQRAGHTWPSHLTRVGDHWWVNNMDRSMANGGVYVFDADWQYQRRVPLPADADPIAILPFDGDVLVSDWFGDRVYRVSADGESVSEFASDGLDALLAEFRQRRLAWRTVAYSGFIVVGILLLVLVVQALQNDELRAVAAATGNPAPAVAASEPLWFEPDPKAQRSVERQLRLIWGLPVLLGAGGVALLFKGGVEHAAWLVLLPLVFGVVVAYGLGATLRAFIGTAICLDGDRLRLRDHRGNEHVAPVRAAQFSRSFVATPDAAIFTGNHKLELYDRTDLEKRLIPRLGESARISDWQMQRHLLTIGHSQARLLLVVVLLGLFGLVAYLAVLPPN